jgi:hypothetical protein
MRASARPIAGDGDSSHRLRTESIFGIALGFGFTQLRTESIFGIALGFGFTQNPGHGIMDFAPIPAPFPG